MEKYGRIDVLFNNAGVMPTAPLIEAPKGEWRQMLDINIMGVLNGIAAVLPIMVEQNQGRLLLLILWTCRLSRFGCLLWNKVCCSSNYGRIATRTKRE